MPINIPQSHCNSYYAATVNEIEKYPQLEGAHNCDVCIIGGGFTGISSALELAERGYKVSVIEAIVSHGEHPVATAVRLIGASARRTPKQISG